MNAAKLYVVYKNELLLCIFYHNKYSAFVLEYLFFSKTLHFLKYRFSFIALQLATVVVVQCEENKIKPIGVKV
jgi:hypothetical protein